MFWIVASIIGVINALLLPANPTFVGGTSPRFVEFTDPRNLYQVEDVFFWTNIKLNILRIGAYTNMNIYFKLADRNDK